MVRRLFASPPKRRILLGQFYSWWNLCRVANANGQIPRPRARLGPFSMFAPHNDLQGDSSVTHSFDYRG